MRSRRRGVLAILGVCGLSCGGGELRALGPTERRVSEPRQATAPSQMEHSTQSASKPSPPGPAPTGAAADADEPPAVAEPEPEAEPEHHEFQEPLLGAVVFAKTPAHRWANLSPAACNAELVRRNLPATGAGRPTPGVANPRRLAGPLHGVRFVTPGKKSALGVLDCRLLLTLNDMAEVLAKHDVVSVRVDNFYRPNAHLPGRRTKSQHAYGLAMDVWGFTLKDGHELSVERDWGGGVGEKACGPDSTPASPSPGTVALRNIVCELTRAGVFHHLLTPGFNASHRNHLHLDIRRGDTAIIVR